MVIFPYKMGTSSNYARRYILFIKTLFTPGLLLEHMFKILRNLMFWKSLLFFYFIFIFLPSTTFFNPGVLVNSKKNCKIKRKCTKQFLEATKNVIFFSQDCRNYVHHFLETLQLIFFCSTPSTIYFLGSPPPLLIHFLKHHPSTICFFETPSSSLISSLSL